jgi:hypothetical protein
MPDVSEGHLRLLSDPRWLRLRQYLSRGCLAGASGQTLGSFYERWKRQAAETGKPSERTLIAYDELWRLYIAPKLQDQSLNTITRADAERVVHAAAERSAWRAHDALKVLRRLLSAAVAAEAIARNPARRVPTPNIEQGRPVGPHG